MSEQKSTGDNLVPPESQQESVEAAMRGNECREEKKQRAQAMLKSDAKAKTEGRDASQPSDSLLPRVSMESEDCHSERVTSNSMSKASTADGVETRATTDRGSQVIEPGAHRVATGRSTSSSEIRDEEGDPAPPSLSPPQPDGSQAPPQQRLSQNVRVDAEQSTMDLAPLILEAVVVTEATRQVATTRNSATKPVLVEGRPETPNRRRVWLILLGLLTLGVAVGISVGITENRPKESASQSANDVAPTAPPTLAPTTVAILEDFLSSLPDPTRNMIDAYPSSPQAKAFAWLSRPQHPRYESREMWRFMQRFALATLYYSTEGDLWRKNAGWLNETVSECEWFGCLCTTSTNDTVQSVIVDGNNLNGTIPTEIGFLTGLEDLGLYSNHLHGTLPTEIGLLTNLFSLYLYDNVNMNGRLPTELANLPHLASIVLYNTSFTGSIPTELGSLSSSLDTLVLSNSSLTSSIPTELGLLTMLYYLYLDGNQLIGAIPTELGRLETIYSVDLGHNALTGRIPSEVATLPTISELYLQENSLNGRIPTDWVAIESLLVLRLDGNELTGPIPSDLGNFPFLTVLDVHANRLTGTVPEGVCQLVSGGGLSVKVDCNEVTCSCGCLCA